MSEETLQWVNNMTNPLEKEAIKKLKKPYSLIRNSTANIGKWKVESPPERIRVIERVCQPLIELIEKISVENNM